MLIAAFQVPAALAVVSALFTAALAQRLEPQINTWNSTFELTAEHIAAAGLTPGLAQSINVAVRFEQTNWATGSVLADPFYTSLPGNASNAPAGSLLKLEAYTDVSTYTIAPALALSRFVYQSRTFNGTLVPVSAYILWPYLPRGGASQAPVVVWGHGTSGIYAECAPSHVRNLWNQFTAPYTLALAGYAVVAPDYAGLGVPFYPNGDLIVHPYGLSPAHGNDLLYAAQAAKAAFPSRLTRDFVVMGHSQGGGAAWAAAEQQVKLKLPGYLGTIALAPTTDGLGLARTVGLVGVASIQVANAIISVFPNVSFSDILTPLGLASNQLLEQVQGCNSAYNALALPLLFSGAVLSQPEFEDGYYINRWQNISLTGGKDFQGPLLVLHGTADGSIPESFTSDAVEATCKRYPRNQLHYVRAQNVGHTSILYATQQLWMDWLDDRFGLGHSSAEARSEDSSHASSQTAARKRCTVSAVGTDTPRPLSQYQSELSYYLMLSQDIYTIA
ncbi:hypothetical protein S40285_03183 [Stachybotrys chlorohalonatus IBT 40285]|uniref:AB hydrolase-1 domain-containing protein n=1 Tax=Stachybotrys chlorohalonatus (strain IBT 40285) TaxID=1283841 RepID=A0A084QI68_STAC4|nr:hypothetical protein S40285_03183 [Stachybotrys chlorohalonata IBT 40285]